MRTFPPPVGTAHFAASRGVRPALCQAQNSLGMAQLRLEVHESLPHPTLHVFRGILERKKERFITQRLGKVLTAWQSDTCTPLPKSAFNSAVIGHRQMSLRVQQFISSASISRPLFNSYRRPALFITISLLRQKPPPTSNTRQTLTQPSEASSD